MTNREFVRAAARQERVERNPVLNYPEFSELSDVVVVRSADDPLDATKTTLLEVINPFGLALARGIDLNAELRANPESAIFDELLAEVRKKIAAGARFDGIFYRLHGADAKHCSPMQYGGYYLEADRMLLSEAANGLIFVLVVAGQGAYFDFIIDLPGDVFAWDVPTTGVDDAAMRAMRKGALCSSDPASEFLLDGAAALVDQLENHLVASL